MRFQSTHRACRVAARLAGDRDGYDPFGSACAIYLPDGGRIPHRLRMIQPISGRRAILTAGGEDARRQLRISPTYLNLRYKVTLGDIWPLERMGGWRHGNRISDLFCVVLGSGLAPGPPHSSYHFDRVTGLLRPSALTYFAECDLCGPGWSLWGLRNSRPSAPNLQLRCGMRRPAPPAHPLAANYELVLL